MSRSELMSATPPRSDEIRSAILDLSREEDREILESDSKLVDHVADVFDRITESPFGP